MNVIWNRSYTADKDISESINNQQEYELYEDKNRTCKQTNKFRINQKYFKSTDNRNCLFKPPKKYKDTYKNRELFESSYGLVVGRNPFEKKKSVTMPKCSQQIYSKIQEEKEEQNPKNLRKAKYKAITQRYDCKENYLANKYQTGVISPTRVNLKELQGSLIGQINVKTDKKSQKENMNVTPLAKSMKLFKKSYDRNKIGNSNDSFNLNISKNSSIKDLSKSHLKVYNEDTSKLEHSKDWYYKDIYPDTPEASEICMEDYDEDDDNDNDTKVNKSIHSSKKSKFSKKYKNEENILQESKNGIKYDTSCINMLDYASFEPNSSIEFKVNNNDIDCLKQFENSIQTTNIYQNKELTLSLNSKSFSQIELLNNTNDNNTSSINNYIKFIDQSDDRLSTYNLYSKATQSLVNVVNNNNLPVLELKPLNNNNNNNITNNKNEKPNYMSLEQIHDTKYKISRKSSVKSINRVNNDDHNNELNEEEPINDSKQMNSDKENSLSSADNNDSLLKQIPNSLASFMKRSANYCYPIKKPYPISKKYILKCSQMADEHKTNYIKNKITPLNNLGVRKKSHILEVRDKSKIKTNNKLVQNDYPYKLMCSKYKEICLQIEKDKRKQ